MKRKSISITCLFLILLMYSAHVLHAQVYGGYVIASAKSKSFGEYADYINQNPKVTEKLENFSSGKGFNVGFELPIVPNLPFFGFQYRSLSSSASLTHSDVGKVDFYLKRRQFLLPTNIGFADGEKRNFAALGISLIPGYANNKIEINYTRQSGSYTSPEIYNSAQALLGGGIFLMIATRGFGFMSRFSYIGNMLKSDDRKNFTNKDASYPYTNYEITYPKDGGKSYVKADMAGLSFEIGLLILIAKYN